MLTQQISLLRSNWQSQNENIFDMQSYCTILCVSLVVSENSRRHSGKSIQDIDKFEKKNWLLFLLIPPILSFFHSFAVFFFRGKKFISDIGIAARKDSPFHSFRLLYLQLSYICIQFKYYLTSASSETEWYCKRKFSEHKHPPRRRKVQVMLRSHRNSQIANIRHTYFTTITR